jgi:hypothetical protein
LLQWEEKLAKRGVRREDSHWTRQHPKRAEQILAGGSLYWVIDGEIRVRHTILRLDEVKDKEGQRFCAIVYNPTVILVEPRPRRPFQGWRYLPDEDAPADLPRQEAARRLLLEEENLPRRLRKDLKDLGLV